MIRVVVLLSALLLCGAGEPRASSADAQKLYAFQLSRADIDAFVEAHNTWRARVRLLPVRWSAELAASAQRWSERLARRGCRLDHDPSSSAGENIFFASALRAEGRDPEVNLLTPRQIVDAWGGESAYYSYARNRCASGRRCGHYVQMVWATTDRVGCGGSVCANRGVIWVCRYTPPAVEGRRPY